MTSSAKWFLFLLLAFLSALSLFATVPAQAQTTVWSATQTVGNGISGCALVVGSNPCSSALSDDDFSYNSVSYEVTRLFTFNSLLTLALDKAVPTTLVLHVGSRQFRLADATLSNSNKEATWSTDLNWGPGNSRTVSVSLATPPPPTVSLSVSPNSVLEGSGSFVHLTVTLSRALSSNVTIPLTATAGSAESGDYEILYSSATISAGDLSVSGAYLLSNQDGDEDDETLTVALGTLPSTVTAGTPNSVEITIRDDDRLKLSVEARPTCGTTVTGTSFFLRPERSLVLTPAPAELTKAEIRAIPGGQWKEAVSIKTNGRSGFVSNLTFAELRELFPNFRGYEFRLKDTPSVTARCTWTFQENPPTDPDPMPPDTIPETPTNTGGTGTGGGGGGGSPPGDTPSPDDDPALDSPRCGESDRENLESFYEATGGENWYDNENWNSEEPLDQWFGVDTDEDGSVISLRLSDNNLSGDMPTEELLCLNENTELKELALWENEDLSGDVPEELVWAVERAALRYIADMFNINPEWFEDYEDPFDFEDWHEGVTTDDEGRVTELVLPGEIPESIIAQFKKRREITITTSDGGCAVGASSERVGASALLAAVLMLLVLSRGLRARSN